MMPLDLKDAYWDISICPYFCKYLSFHLDREKYQFRALAFGLSIAPRIFAKMTKLILKENHLLSNQAFAYLAEWLIWVELEEH